MTKGISSYFLSVPISMLVGSLKSVPGQVTATRDAPAERIQNLFLYNTTEWRKKLIMDDRDWNTSWGKRQKKKLQSRGSNMIMKRCDIVSKIKLVYKEIHINVTRNLNDINARIIIINCTPHMEMETKVINSFKSEIHRIADEILD